MTKQDDVFATHPQPGLVLPQELGQPWNLGVVDNERKILRGAAPANRGVDPAKALAWLRTQGVQTLAVLNGTEQGIDREAELAMAADHGTRAVCFDWEEMQNEKKAGDEPQWRRFVSLAQEGSLYVHCVWGVDRTGATLARARRELYRWTADEAFRELRAFGFAFEHSRQELQQYHKDVLDYFDFAIEDYEPLQPGDPDHDTCLVREQTAIG